MGKSPRDTPGGERSVGGSERVRELLPYPYVAVRPEGVIDSVNGAWTDLVGLKSSAVEGRRFADLLAAGSAERFEDALEEASAEVAPDSDALETLELDLVREDGVVTPVVLDGRVERTEGGRVHRIHCQLRELESEHDGGAAGAEDPDSDGERVRIRDVLAESEARYRSMAEALDVSGVATFILDDSFSVVWVNEAVEEYFGVTRDRLVGTDKASMIESDIKHIFADPERFAETVLASYEDNSYVESFECHVLPGDGRAERWLFHWSTPIERGRYAGGRIEHYTDVTERHEYAARLESQLEDLDVLNEMVRHDIRNDLQQVLAYADFLADHVDAEGEAHVETILDNAEHAVDLTTTAREMTDVMLTSDEGRREVSLRPALESAVDGVRTVHSDAVVTVEGSVPAVSVEADDLLDSVFRNLLKNAIQHNDQAVPEVAVSARVTEGCVTEGRVVVRVADNGPGVPDDRKEAVFGRGEKGLRSTGTGLGLYLVDTLVDSYGGRVRVEDNDPEGAVFVVELPLAE